jgi:hypothetical protein
MRKHIVNTHQTPWSTIVKYHGHKSSNTMVEHHQNSWSTIIKHLCQQSSNTMVVKHRQTPWSQIIKHHGQTSSTHMVPNHQTPWSHIINNHDVHAPVVSCCWLVFCTVGVSDIELSVVVVVVFSVHHTSNLHFVYRAPTLLCCLVFACSMCRTLFFVFVF